MDFVSILVNLFWQLCSLDLFIIFVCSFGVLSLFSVAVHFVSGKRVLYK